MKTLVKLLLLLTLGAVILLPGMAVADYTMSATFGYQWTDPGVGNGQNNPGFKYDQFNTSLTAGSEGFSSLLVGSNAASISFNDAAWAGSYIDATHSTAFGPEKNVGQLIWDYNFTGTNPLGPTYPYTIKIDYYDKGVSLGYELYNITGVCGYNGNYTPVPLPPSMLLLCSGLVGLVGLRRFKRS